MKQYLIIHYGEIALKGDNRKFFEDKLISNIRYALKELGSLQIKHIAGRIIINLYDEYNLDYINVQLKKIFGIEYFVFAHDSDQEIKKIEKNVFDLIKNENYESFRVTTRRVNKNYPLHSQEVSEQVGAMVVRKMKKKVDLEKFDLNIRIDLVRDHAFIYFKKIECRGGLPVGVSGELFCLLSGGIDSPVAANLMQKRGSKINFINFDSYPSTPKENQEKVKDLAKVLSDYQSDTKLFIVPFLNIQKEILKNCPETYRVVFYRRMMLRIAQNIAEDNNSLALVTGESLGQVASQTVENIRGISQAIDMPILRPLIGTNKEEITIIAKQIGTYEISIQPFADCCSLFVPKHPVTRSDLDLILETEKKWKYKGLLDKAVKDTEIIKI